MAGGASSGTTAGVPSPWEGRFPDESIAIEQNKLSGAALAVVASAFVVGFLVGHTIWPDYSARWIPADAMVRVSAYEVGITAIPFVAMAVLFAVWMVRKRSMTAAIVCLAISLTEGVVLGLFVTWIIAAVQAGVVLMLVSAILALRRLRRRIAEEAERNPLVAQYRLLLALLARIVVVDGHVDRREVASIQRICDTSRIAPDLRDRFVAESLEQAEAGQDDLEDLASRYLSCIGQGGFPHPERTALMAALAVAAADGVIGDREDAEIRALGQALKLNAAEVAGEIDAHRAHFSEVTVDQARALLALSEGWNEAELEVAHRELRNEIAGDDFDHLGDGLSSYARARVELLDRAYETLRAVA